MSLTFYPFKPDLQGTYLERFHTKAFALCQMPEEDRKVEITRLAGAEYEWATEKAKVNPRQRRIYRTIWLLLRDLLRVGWSCRWYDGNLEVAPSLMSAVAHNEKEKHNLKDSVRNAMLDARHNRLLDSKDFIERMEAPSASARVKVPISALVADGVELAAALKGVAALGDDDAKLAQLRTVIRPYLQLVTDDVCPITGHRLGDIWRYFRLTWSSPAENTPGRTMLYLVRDAARPNHPVMGLASLENAPIKVLARDKYLGWELDEFVKELQITPAGHVQEQFHRLIGYIDVALSDLNLDGLCTKEECEAPDDSLIDRLVRIAAQAGEEREQALRRWTSEEREDDEPQERSQLGNISLAAEEALYKRKRAEQLGRLLVARKCVQEVLAVPQLDSHWTAEVKKDIVQTAIRTALQAQKSRHVGTSILELNVCGAIPPYNEILGGKLVALAMLSPQVVADYRERYGNRASDIASRLKGEDVIRPAELVYVGTTSLYRVGSSQYNRLKLPGSLLRSHAAEVKWEEIGTTEGYGTLHISSLTLQCLDEVSRQKGIQHVNHVFGEGPSPKMRIIRQGLDAVFEAGQRFVTSEIPKHAMGRRIYGAWLATNGRAYLLGKVPRPEYYFDHAGDPKAGTDEIVGFWLKRWLLSRLSHTEALDRIETFNPNTLLVGNQLDRDKDPTHEPIRAEADIVSDTGTSPGTSILDYVRSLYRGSSSFADQIDYALLKAIHIETDLDREIVEALKSGKSVVLTGNPGDGKSHLQRVLAPQLEQLTTAPVIELDASSVPDADLYHRWKQADLDGRPFCVAINQAVLFKLAADYRDFMPLQQARAQVETGVHYDSVAAPGDDSTVVVYDLSRRNVLSERMIEALLARMTDEQFIPRCATCPAEGCDFTRNRRLLKDVTFRARLQGILDRVSLRGYHATLREIEGFVSYLLFGGRSCLKLLDTGGDVDRALPQLPFNGEGRLFDEIRKVFDPSRITHPIWDERLVTGDFSSSEWGPAWSSEVGSVDPNTNTSNRFAARKRAFYFFHNHGQTLLDLAGTDEQEFAALVNVPERDGLRVLFRKINKFYGVDCGNDTLRVWQSHRYNQSPRRVLYSVNDRTRKEFEIVRPQLAVSMQRAFDLPMDHLILRLKAQPLTRLRVDFSLYELLSQAERGVPVMYLDGDATRRLWQFMQQLATPLDMSDDTTIVIHDPVSGERLTVNVDIENRRYLSIEAEA